MKIWFHLYYEFYTALMTRKSPDYIQYFLNLLWIRRPRFLSGTNILAIYVTLTFDQMTLNTKTVTWSNSVPDFSAKSNNSRLSYSAMNIEKFGAVPTIDFTVDRFQSSRCLRLPITHPQTRFHQNPHPRLSYFRGAPTREYFSQPKWDDHIKCR